MLRFGLQGSNLNAAPKDNICDFTYEVETSSRFVLGDFARTLHLKLYRDGTEVKTVPCTERLIIKMGIAEKMVFLRFLLFCQMNRFTRNLSSAAIVIFGISSLSTVLSIICCIPPTLTA